MLIKRYCLNPIRLFTDKQGKVYYQIKTEVEQHYSLLDCDYGVRVKSIFKEIRTGEYYLVYKIKKSDKLEHRLGQFKDFKLESFKGKEIKAYGRNPRENN